MSEDLQKDFNSFLYIGEVLAQTGVIRELEKVLCHPSGSIYHVASDAEARAIVENYRVSAIIIDQYQPHCSGLDLMRWLQGLAAIPVIIVIRSSNFRDTDIVVALEAGATDAVQDDISPRELAARIRAGIRKYFHGNTGGNLDTGSAAPSGSVAPGHRYPQYFNPESGRVYFSDSSRSVLHGKEADLLNLLIVKQPAYIDREEISGELFQQSWNPNDRRIDNLVSRLRRMLDAGSTDAADSVIETVRNEGYRLRAPIALISMDNVQALALVRDECPKQ
jgi:two-component system, OmpR family, response regulator